MDGPARQRRSTVALHLLDSPFIPLDNVAQEPDPERVLLNHG
jgi:hypothetical protein